MRTILVPTDFSDTSRNSCRYAADFAVQTQASRIVLYNAYSMPLATEMSWAILQTEELQAASAKNLQQLKAEMTGWTNGKVAIETLSDFGFLQERIADAVERTGADLIIMGITGGGRLEQVIMGSNTTHVIHHVDVPVLIVPPDAAWKPVARLGWACDYKDIQTTTPATAIRSLLTGLGASMVVAHNDPEAAAFDPNEMQSNLQVKSLFHDFKPSFVTLRQEDFTEAIEAFVSQEKIDMLLVIPKKHSWLQSLFYRSHTTRLAFHSHIPMMCVKVQEQS